MSLISENIMEAFSEWADRNEDKSIFPVISKEEDTYYIDRKSEQAYTMEYSFETMTELKNLLEAYSGLSDDPQILKKLTIEIMQDRFKGQLEMQGDIRSNEAGNGGNTLPDHVYVF